MMYKRPPLPELPPVIPAPKISSPPDPESPDPTVKYTEPPRPDTAEPDPTYIPPLFPDDDDPVLKTTYPLTPLLPAFAVCINMSLLELFELEPPSKYSFPPLPLLLELVPADMTNSPPVPESPNPTVK
jgi:hypothetical protein